MEESKRETVIVKRVRKIRHARHGGNWKVAYADFVTALMALFLLLWLLTVIPPEERKKLAGYLDNYHLFYPSGESILEGRKLTFEQAGTPHGEGVAPLSRSSAESIMKLMQKEVELKMGKLREHVIVEIVDNMMRVHIVDKEGAPMFPLGETEPTPLAKKILRLTAGILKEKGNRIAVEGHTDAYPFATGDRSNWDLSTMRAVTARRELEAGGVKPGMFDRVAGYAETLPLIKENPYDPRNRRISLLLLPEVPEMEPSFRVLDR